MIMNTELKLFAGENTDFYEAALSYFCDKQNSVENKNLMHDAFMSEVERKSGIARSGNETSAWMAHPSVKWASFAIVDAVINAIIPQTILPQFGMFCDFRTIGLGDVQKFTVMPNTMYTISVDGRGTRNTIRQRKFKKDVILTPVMHSVTVYQNMYNVLAGRSSVADFMGFLLLSVETEMYKDALATLTSGLSAIPAGDQNVSGAYDVKTLVKMCEVVQAKNGGVRPVIVGSATALVDVVPDATTGWRIMADGKAPAIELVRSVIGYDVVKLDPAVDNSGSLVLPSNVVYVISPSQDKLVKGVMSTTLSNSNGFYDNADLTQDFTYHKEWNFAFASAAHAGIYTISA